MRRAKALGRMKEQYPYIRWEREYQYHGFQGRGITTSGESRTGGTEKEDSRDAEVFSRAGYEGDGI